MNKQFFRKYLYYLKWIRLNFYTELIFILLANKYQKLSFFNFLILRFSKLSLTKRYSSFLWRRYYLPTVINLHLTYRIDFYASIFICLGNFNFLPINYTYSGIKLPFLILYRKKSFWKSLESCFISYSYNTFLGSNSLVFYKRIKFLNLFTNYYNSLSWFVGNRFIFPQLSIWVIKKTWFQQNLFRNFFFNTKLLKPKLNWFMFSLDRYWERPKLIKFQIINIFYRQLIVLKKERLNIQQLFFSRFKRVGYLTTFFNWFRYKNIRGLNLLYYFELRLINILLRAHFIVFFSDGLKLIKQGLVFVNGHVCLDENYLVNIGDRVQLGINKFSYLYMRLGLSNLISKEYKLYPYMYKHKLNRQRDQNSWPIKLGWGLEDIPKYLEVDFSTLTIFIIYKPLVLNEFLPLYVQSIKFLNFNSYNWRYFY